MPKFRIVRKLGRGDADLCQHVTEAKLGELTYRVRLEIDADPERQQLGDRFIEPDAQSQTMRTQSECKPADPGSNDDDVHDPKKALFADRDIQ